MIEPVYSITSAMRSWFSNISTTENRAIETVDRWFGCDVGWWNRALIFSFLSYLFHSGKSLPTVIRYKLLHSSVIIRLRYNVIIAQTINMNDDRTLPITWYKLYDILALKWTPIDLIYAILVFNLHADEILASTSTQYHYGDGRLALR